VNLTLSKRGDYVVRSALCLARAYPSGGHRKIRTVVAEMGVPQTYASQILADLVRAGLARSKAGRDGGYSLTRMPAAISMLEVVEAGEGPLRSERCALGEGPCRWDAVCPLHESWRAATGAMRAVLAGITLAEVAARDEELERGEGTAPPDSHRHAHRSLSVEDEVQVECDLRTTLMQLQEEVWLSHCVQDAYAEMDTLRARMDPGGLSWISGASPALELTPPVESNGEAVTRGLVWAVMTPGSAESRLESTLELRSLDPERTLIHLSGRFRPPITALTLDDEQTARLTQAAIRAFLRGLATGIESQVGSPLRQLQGAGPAK